MVPMALVPMSPGTPAVEGQKAFGENWTGDSNACSQGLEARIHTIAMGICEALLIQGASCGYMDVPILMTLVTSYSSWVEFAALDTPIPISVSSA